ncbi:hypothetical protein H9L39_03056 [Fusarium oxysporum f. sp. albedinis]|nr:hypothetical protein H9L39_03056 [Fusarium oxysporum f. sp. albedinis]
MGNIKCSPKEERCGGQRPHQAIGELVAGLVANWLDKNAAVGRARDATPGGSQGIPWAVVLPTPVVKSIPHFMAIDRIQVETIKVDIPWNVDVSVYDIRFRPLNQLLSNLSCCSALETCPSPDPINSRFLQALAISGRSAAAGHLQSCLHWTARDKTRSVGFPALQEP